MADYSIISEISQSILQFLRDKMCPTPIDSPNHIEVVSPSDPNPDYVLGLYLYDIREEGEVSTLPMRRSGQTRLTKSPRPCSLYYMIFLNASAQAGLKAADAQRVIGRAFQIMGDRTAIDSSELQPWLDKEEPPVLLTSSRLSLEDKVRVWQAVDKPYQLSLYYKAAPVFIASEITVDVPRVREVDIFLRDAKEEGGEE